MVNGATPFNMKIKKISLIFIVVGIAIALILAYFLFKIPATQIQISSEIPTNQTVLIRKYAFEPNETEVISEATISWLNRDGVTHDITIDSVSFKKDILPGQILNYTFNESGIYDYYCARHPSMKGKIIVR